MRVISQGGTMDVPYEISSFSMAVGKYENVEHAVIFCYNYSTSMGTKMAEYGSKEKAKKAMEMLRKAYVGNIVMFQNVEPTDELKEMLKIHGIEAIYATLDNQPQEIKFENHQNFYFQFPTEEELE